MGSHKERECQGCGLEPHEAIVDAVGKPLWVCLGCYETTDRKVRRARRAA